MSKEQPEAIRLADELESFRSSSHRTSDGAPMHLAIAAELRRLHAENEALRAQIGQGVPSQAASDAYDRIDHFLRQKLDDHDYAHYSFDLDLVWGAYTAPQQNPLLFSEIWDNDAIMEVNADARLPFEMIERFVRAVEAAHNIGEKK